MRRRLLCGIVFALCAMGVQAKTVDEVKAIIRKVNTYWQTNNPAEVRSFWDNAAYHTGNMEVYKLLKDQQMLDYSIRWAEHNQWKGATEPDPAKWKYKNYGEGQDYVLFGDWQICFQTYIDLYLEESGERREEREYMVGRAKEVMGYEADSKVHDYWWWADALYMVMPVMTKMYRLTGDEKYLRKLYDNIAEFIDAPETDRQSHSKGFLSEEEEVRLLSVVEGSPRDYALVFLMLTTGLRTTEIVNADLEDLKEVGGELRLYVLGKGRKTKKDFVKISRDASRFLEEYVGDRTSGPIFLSESNRNEPGRLTTRSVSRIIKDALKESGIDSPSITAHSLRHTVAVQNLLSGGTLEETRELLRHRDARSISASAFWYLPMMTALRFCQSMK